MEINQLRHLVAAAREKSFTKAAGLCFTTRQSVARSIRELETELGSPLFAREGNAMILTTVGEVAVEQAQSILDAVDSLKALCGSQTAAPRRMRMAMSLNFLSGALTDAVSLVDEYAATDRILELSAKECYECVCARDVDAAIITAMERDFPMCSSIDVASMTAYLLVDEGSRLAQLPSCSVADLREVSLVLMPDPAFQYEPMFKLLSAFGVDESSVSIVPSQSSMLHIVKRVKSAGCIVTNAYYGNPPRGTAVVPIVDHRLCWHIYMLYNVNPETYVSVSSLAKRLREVAN
ncbi:MAG: LysR family transcriptional regulator [Eggerthellaceae bacterium]|nr:LysR family transcriptional regulator [Eggerthellaceae bacterium]